MGIPEGMAEDAAAVGIRSSAAPAQGDVTLPLPADPQAARLARSFVHERWAELDDDVLDDVLLMVSEMVTNAVQHGKPDIVLRLCSEPFAIDVSVLDHGPDLPSALSGPPDVRAASGRGLFIIDNLANRWGIEPLDGEVGKTVWARMDLTPGRGEFR